MKLPRITLGLRALLVGGMVVVITSLMTVTTFIDIERQRETEQEDLEQRGLLLANAVNYILPGPIREKNMNRVGEVASAIWAQPDVSFVKVFNSGGDLLVGPGQDHYPTGVNDLSVIEEVGSLHPSVRWSEGTLVITSAVVAGAQPVGAVQFGLNSARIDDEIAALTRSRILQTLALLAAGVGVSFLIANYLLVPLGMLVHATNRLARGDLSARVDDLAGREMKALGRSFNRMADELETKIRELEESRLRIVTGQENVRREIATHLHGSVQGSLLAMKVDLDDLARREDLDEEVAVRIKNIATTLNEVTQTEIAGVSRRLYPTIIRRGLVPSLQSLLDRFESSLSLEVHFDEGLMGGGNAGIAVPEQTRLAAYRIADEALTNAVKHAPRSHVSIDLEVEGECLVLTVRDDGPGFDPATVSAGLGLTSIQDHAGAVGGTATITSQPNKGTEVWARLPLEA